MLLGLKERRVRQWLQILQEQTRVESYGPNSIRGYRLVKE